MTTAILTITCPDRKGIVAKLTSEVFAQDGNIVNLDQFTDHEQKLFFMRLEWEAKQIKPLSAGQLFDPSKKQKVAIFVSKYDHCLYDILLRNRSGELNCTISCIISNHPDLEFVAKTFGVPFYNVKSESKQIEILQKHQVELIVLARYMQVLSSKFLAKYPNQVINVHHSFLPAFKGAKPYHQAYAKGVKIIGATAHFATKDLDQGPIISQEVTEISHRDTVNDLITKGRDLERQVLAKAIRLYLDHRLFVCQNRTIIL